MTDRVRHLTVILDEDYRTDDLQPLVDAILLLRGVEHVQPHVTDGNASIARINAKLELRRQLLEILKP